MFHDFAIHIDNYYYSKRGVVSESWIGSNLGRSVEYLFGDKRSCFHVLALYVSIENRLLGLFLVYEDFFFGSKQI